MNRPAPDGIRRAGQTGKEESSMAISGSYFEVALVGVGAVLAGGFTSVSGLGMEADYEV